MLLLPAKVDEFLSKREKKAAGLEQHKKLQREKDQKRKQKKQVSLPAKHSKGKKIGALRFGRALLYYLDVNGLTRTEGTGGKHDIVQGEKSNET
jgi:hypothetical protein